MSKHGRNHPLLNLFRIEVCKIDGDTVDKIRNFTNEKLVKWLNKLLFDRGTVEAFEKGEILAGGGEQVKIDGEKLLMAENRENIVRNLFHRLDLKIAAADTLLNFIRKFEEESLVVGSGHVVSDEEKRVIEAAAAWILGNEHTRLRPEDAVYAMPENLFKAFLKNEEVVTDDSKWEEVCEKVANSSESSGVARRLCMGKGTITDRFLRRVNYGEDLRARIKYRIYRHREGDYGTQGPMINLSEYQTSAGSDLPSKIEPNPYGSYPVDDQDMNV